MHRFNRSIGFVFIMFALSLMSLSVSSADLNKIELNKTKSVSADRSMRNDSKGIDLNDFEIFYDSIVVRNKDGFKALSKPKVLDINNSVNAENVTSFFSLDNNEYVVLKGPDTRRQLFNGSIIIKFNEIPDLAQYAQEHNIVFVRDLSDIQRGVFRINNMYDLGKIIVELQNDDNIHNIELDLIDPSVRPE